MTEKIYEPNDNFPFDKLELAKPILVNGGNYFIQFIVQNSPLYIQPPKCMTKQGIIKGNKRMYSDLMFNNENQSFIRWMENIETHCHKVIYENRSNWFEGDLEMHDIENYFTSPMKVFKSGKFYIVRSNISLVLGKPTLHIYDEQENEVDFETLTDETNVMTILELQGIKCSARSFQIEIEIKQMMVIKPSRLFEKCVIKTLSKPTTTIESETESNSLDKQNVENVFLLATETLDSTLVVESKDSGSDSLATADLANSKENKNDLEDNREQLDETEKEKGTEKEKEMSTEPSPLLQEVDFDLEELPTENSIKIKKRNDVYYEMYKEARQKAKIARDLALSAFLEAKNIKNKYLLDDISDTSSNEDESMNFE